MMTRLKTQGLSNGLILWISFSCGFELNFIQNATAGDPLPQEGQENTTALASDFPQIMNYDIETKLGKIQVAAPPAASNAVSKSHFQGDNGDDSYREEDESGDLNQSKKDEAARAKREVALLYYKDLTQKIGTELADYQKDLVLYKDKIRHYVGIKEANLSAVDPRAYVKDEVMQSKLKFLHSRQAQIQLAFKGRNKFIQDKIEEVGKFRRQIFNEEVKVGTTPRTFIPQSLTAGDAELSNQLRNIQAETLSMERYIGDLYSQIALPIETAKPQMKLAAEQLSHAKKAEGSLQKTYTLAIAEAKKLTTDILQRNLGELSFGELKKKTTEAEKLTTARAEALRKSKEELKSLQIPAYQLKKAVSRSGDHAEAQIVSALHSLKNQMETSSDLGKELSDLIAEFEAPEVSKESRERLKVLSGTLQSYFNEYNLGLGKELNYEKNKAVEFQKKLKKNLIKKNELENKAEELQQKAGNSYYGKAKAWISGSSSPKGSQASKEGQEPTVIQIPEVDEDEETLLFNSTHILQEQLDARATPAIAEASLLEVQKEYKAQADLMEGKGKAIAQTERDLAEFRSQHQNLREGADRNGEDLYSKNTREIVKTALAGDPDYQKYLTIEAPKDADRSHADKETLGLSNFYLELVQGQKQRQAVVSEFTALTTEIEKKAAELEKLPKDTLPAATQLGVEKLKESQHIIEVEKYLEEQHQKISDLKVELFKFLTLGRSDKATLNEADKTQLKSLVAKYDALSKKSEEKKETLLASMAGNSDQDEVARLKARFERLQKKTQAHLGMLNHFTTSQDTLGNLITQMNQLGQKGAEERKNLHESEDKSEALGKETAAQRSTDRKHMAAAVGVGIGGGMLKGLSSFKMLPSEASGGIGAAIGGFFGGSLMYLYQSGRDTVKGWFGSDIYANQKKQKKLTEEQQKVVDGYNRQTAALMQDFDEHIQDQRLNTDDLEFAEILKVGSPASHTQYAEKRKVWDDALVSLEKKQSFLGRLTQKITGSTREYIWDERLLTKRYEEILGNLSFRGSSGESKEVHKARCDKFKDAKEAEQKVWIEMLALEQVKKLGLKEKLDDLRLAKKNEKQEVKDYKWLLSELSKVTEKEGIDGLKGRFTSLRDSDPNSMSENELNLIKREIDEIQKIVSLKKKTVRGRETLEELSDKQKFLLIKKMLRDYLKRGLLEKEKFAKELPLLIKIAEKENKIQDRELAHLQRIGLLLSAEYQTAVEIQENATQALVCEKPENQTEIKKGKGMWDKCKAVFSWPWGKRSKKETTTEAPDPESKYEEPLK